MPNYRLPPLNLAFPPLLLLLLLGALLTAGSVLTAESRVSSSSRTVSIRQELAIVASTNSSVYKEALQVLEVDGCRAAVQKAATGKANFLLEPLLCWRPGMEQLLCPGFDYVRSRHFLRVPVLLTDPAVPDKAKRLLRALFPTSLNFMNPAAVQFRLAAGPPIGGSVEIELEDELGAVGGRMHLLLRAYCKDLEHCRAMRRGLTRQPSLFFEKLQLSLNSSEYPGLKRSLRTVSSGPFACRNERLQEMASGGDVGDSQLGVLAVNQTKIVEVDGRLFFLVQQRSSGMVSFQRPFADYEDGFGHPSDDYWMGLRMLNILTKTNRALRVELIRHRSSTFDQDLFNAEYTNFKVGAPPNYAMTYSALNKAKSTVVADALRDSRGRAFSTMDRDNDRWGQSCSVVKGGSGGWWFNNCGKTNPNGLFFGSNVRNESGIRWEYLDSRTLNGNATLKYIRILLSI